MSEKTEQAPEPTGDSKTPAKPMTLVVLRNRMKDVCGRINDGKYGEKMTDDSVWACIRLLDEYRDGLTAPAGDVGKVVHDAVGRLCSMAFQGVTDGLTDHGQTEGDSLGQRIEDAVLTLEHERDDLYKKCKIFCNPDGIIATNMVTIQAGRDLAGTMIQRLLPALEAAIEATPTGDKRNALCDLNIEARALLERLKGDA